MEQVHQFKNVENLRRPHRKRDIENKTQTWIHASEIMCITLGRIMLRST